MSTDEKTTADPDSDGVHDPIAALATPYAQSAVAVIRASGARVIELIAPLFSRPEKLRDAPRYTIMHGRFQDRDGRTIDEVLVNVFRAPHSYTGEDSVEINSHGSLPVIERILETLYSSGFRPAEPGEFTLRAFLTGKLDLTRAEAVNEIIRARSDRARSLAMNRLGGSIERAIDSVKGRLVDILARVEIQLDYPEEDTGEVVIPPEVIDETIVRLESLVATYRIGRVYQEGVRVAIAGRTNAGKSSLFNLFVREDRSIVSDVPGTTRDYIEATTIIDGVPVRLFDTAGLRVSEDTIETEGVRRSESILGAADLVVYVVDGIEGVVADDERRVEQIADRVPCVVAWNKIDLVDARVCPAGYIGISAETGENVEALRAAIATRITPERGVADGRPVIDSVRQKDLIERALAALRETKVGVDAGVPVDAVALDLQEAIRALGEITGEVTTDDILDAMFSGFCVGK